MAIIQLNWSRRNEVVIGALAIAEEKTWSSKKFRARCNFAVHCSVPLPTNYTTELAQDQLWASDVLTSTVMDNKSVAARATDCFQAEMALLSACQDESQYKVTMPGGSCPMLPR